MLAPRVAGRDPLAIATNWTTAIAVALHQRPPPGPGSGGHLGCTSRVSDARPAQYSTVVVFVATKPAASVVATAHYKTKDTSHATTAGRTGAAQPLNFRISRATKGYSVIVSVAVRLGGAHATCATRFTPQ